MVVILGAGITGAAAAYYLVKSSLLRTSSSPSIVVIDAVGPAACSSGKAGAFLTDSSWKSSTKTQVLHEEAFALHLELAKDLNLNSFNELSGYFVKNNDEDDGCTQKRMPGRCGQVNPTELTNSLLNAASQLGNVKLEINSVKSMSTTTRTDDGQRRLEYIHFESGDSIQVLDDDVIVALGPWSCRLEDWLGGDDKESPVPVPLEGVLSTSMIWKKNLYGLKTDKNVALFHQGDDDEFGCHLEIIPRRTSREVYVSGCGNSQIFNPAIIRGPKRPIPGGEQEQPDSSRVNSVRQSLQNILSKVENKDLPIYPPPPDKLQACIRPNTPDGIPIVGKILDNLYLATGGGPWGITYGPLMGKAVANQILYKDDVESDDIPIRPSLWTPKRFDTLVYRVLMEQRRKEAWGR